MYFTALIDFKAKAISFAEKHATKEEAGIRFGQLALQAELNTVGLNPEVKKGGEWKAYLGEEPFAFPKEEKAKKAEKEDMKK